MKLTAEQSDQLRRSAAEWLHLHATFFDEELLLKVLDNSAKWLTGHDDIGAFYWCTPHFNESFLPFNRRPLSLRFSTIPTA